jgi:urease accessory protein
VVVEPGARLRVRTAAATVTLPGSTTPESHAFWMLEVAGDLDVDPQPTVVAATSRHFTSTRLELTGSGRVRLRERIQSGDPMNGRGFGRARYTPMSRGHRCCGTESNSATDRSPTTRSGRR